MEVTIGTPVQGVGANYSWTSDEQGSGNLTIASATEFSRITNTLDFEGAQGGTATWDLQPEGEGTLATWSMDGGGPLLFTVVADRFIGPMFEDGLSRLKDQAEAWEPPSEPDPVAPSEPMGSEAEAHEQGSAEPQGDEQ